MNANDEAAVSQGCYFDEAAAERVRRFALRCCRHSKGRWAGQPFDFTPDIWENWIRPLYGWKRPDGSRRFRETFAFLPKKNGKSTTVGALALYHLVADGEPAPEVYSAAKDRNQAGIVFREAAMMARASSVLSPTLRIVDSKKAIHYDAGQGVYRCLSADAGSQEGLNVSALLRDELHALRDRKLYDALRYGGAARRQPLSIDITTAGDDRESVCYEAYTYAKRVEAGEVIDTAFLPYIREAAEADDPDDPTVWQKANPSWGVTIDPDEFRRTWQQAKQTASAWAAWRRYRLNQWIEEVAQWLAIDKWDACAAAPAFAPGKPVFGGLDMSSTTDLTAFVLWEPSTYSVRPYFWIPQEAFRNRERRNKERIDAWAGHYIKVIPGARIDHEVIYDDVVRICREHGVKVVGADPYNAVDLLMRLSSKARLNVVAYRQSMLHLSPPMKRVEAMALDGLLRHGGHPVLRWNVKNVFAKTDESDNIRPVKNRSPDKIDGFVALLMAVGVSLQTGDPTSVYATQGV